MSQLRSRNIDPSPPLLPGRDMNVQSQTSATKIAQNATRVSPRTLRTTPKTPFRSQTPTSPPHDKKKHSKVQDSPLGAQKSPVPETPPLPHTPDPPGAPSPGNPAHTNPEYQFKMLQLQPDPSQSLILFLNVDTLGRFLKWLGSVFQTVHSIIPRL